jgi:hypothetical protein
MNIVCINFQGGNHCYNGLVSNSHPDVPLCLLATLFMRFSCYNKLQWKSFLIVSHLPEKFSLN